MKPYLARNEKMMKMKDLRTFNWGIPALRSRAGFLTCPNAGACAAGCFARAGWYTVRKVVMDAYDRRLALSQTPHFEEVLGYEIRVRRVERLRIHDGGDFYSPEYLRRWLTIVRAHPHVRFYTYTKMVSLLKSVDLPANLAVVYSYGGKEDHLILPTDRHCRVFETHEELELAGYADASESDAVAAEGPNHLIGIVFHGQRKWRNTAWSKVKPPAEFHPIPGYVGHYAVSVHGAVKNLQTGQVLTRYTGKTGYPVVHLWMGNKYKTKYLHRLIAEIFLPKVEGKTQINHLDGDKTNNALANLEWSDQTRNARHAVEIGLTPVGSKRRTSKLNEAQAMAIFNLAHEGHLPRKEIASKFNISVTQVHQIKNKKEWKHIHQQKGGEAANG